MSLCSQFYMEASPRTKPPFPAMVSLGLLQITLATIAGDDPVVVILRNKQQIPLRLDSKMKRFSK